MITRKLQIVDMFCGGGGESTGLIQAANTAGYDVELLAINHWDRAIETHAANYPAAEHIQESVEHLDPTKVVPGGKLDLLWASPECTHHSNARGGRPRSDQSRATAWEILKWLGELYVERVIIENVPEFTTWGALDEYGRPIEREKGKTFRAFIQGLRSLGYSVDWKVLCAADYGEATTRRRLFIQAVKGRKRILWPEFTNTEEDNVFHLPKWRAAAEIIDWSIPCVPISERSKPLAPATLRRIEYGIKKYWGNQAEPFLAILRGTSKVASIDKPLSTISTTGAHHSLIVPFLARYNGGDGRVHPVTDPVPTLDTSNRYGLVAPFCMAIGQTSAKDRSRSLTEPLSTICTKQEHCLVSPLTPFVTEYYGNGKARSVKEPLPTVTTKDRFGVTVPCVFDIGFRMLQPSELAAATGFPADYKFTGTKVEVVKQIGNAVPPGFARAMFGKILEGGGRC
ncbi:MAG: DNA cytosine methyltransferase [Spirochaetia bacterium]|nr:DNA cytosine methyltransferase [Spirochaetia bacterium]MBR0318922.1 DNA cytosine methyltransferase [Spirochaetia bacterium]